MSVQDTMGFCTQYFERYKTYSELFVIVEFTGPQHMLWKSLDYTINGSIVTPVVSQKSPELVPNTPEPHEHYQSVFVRHNSKKDYLGQKRLWEHVSPRHIPQHALHRHYEQVARHHEQFAGIFARQISHCYSHVTQLMRWLQERNIAYLFNWATGTHPSFIRLVDRAFKNVGPRLIPMHMYTGFSKGVEWSEKPFWDHPDSIGQQRIAHFMKNYVLEHNLFQAPQKSIAAA